MYDRIVDGKELSFRVSGKLWNRSLVMQDQETGSLWSHILGKCMQGELEGAQLDALPSVMTTWQAWRKRHPDTDVMIWPQDGYQFEKDYYRKFGLEHFVAGLVIGGRSRAYRFDDLTENPLVNDVHESTPLAVLFDISSGAVYAWKRSIGDQVLEFTKPAPEGARASEVATVVDTVTNSRWDLARGVAISGSMKGRQLDPIVVIPSFKAAWDEFHPNSSYWRPVTGDSRDD